MPDKPFGLPRERRLRRRRDFTQLTRMGARGSADALVVLARPTRPGQLGRVGFTVPKKVGKAHERNLVKRRLRHLLRHQKERFRAHDVVVIAREGAAALSFDELAAQLERALGRALEAAAKRPRRGDPRRRSPSRARRG